MSSNLRGSHCLSHSESVAPFLGNTAFTVDSSVPLRGKGWGWICVVRETGRRHFWGFSGNTGQSYRARKQRGTQYLKRIRKKSSIKYLDDCPGEEQVHSSGKGGGWRQQTLEATECGDRWGDPHWEQLSLKDCSQGNNPDHAGAVRDQPQPHPCTLRGEGGKLGLGKEVGGRCFNFCLCFWLLNLIQLIIYWATFPPDKSVLPMVATGKWFPCLCFKWSDFPSCYFHLMSWAGGSEAAAGQELGPWAALTHQCHLILKRKRLIYIPPKASNYAASITSGY